MTSSPVVKLEWELATKLLNAAQQIIIVTHVRPDGDAIGSMCGLGSALREYGKQVTMAVDGGVNDYLSYISGSGTVLAELHQPAADLVIACDSSDLERLGEAGKVAFDLPVPKIVLDHHATNTFFGTAHIVHEDYVSTTEAVFRWLEYMNWGFSPAVVQALMVGYVTDTISFRVGPVTAETMRQVARLMDMGADLRGAIERMLVQTEANQLQLMGRGLARLKVEEHVAWTYLTLADFQEMGLPTSDKPELASEIIRAANAYIACFFLQAEDGEIRLSFRATPGFDVGTLAANLGGGGHTLAAGASLNGMSLEQAIRQVVPLLKEEAKRGTAVYK
jgi:phosphoesterase RecJ-like protein